jgi:hypothetical protein
MPPPDSYQLDEYPDEIEAPSFALRTKCSQCGGYCVDARPNWTEQPASPTKRMPARAQAFPKGEGLGGELALCRVPPTNVWRMQPQLVRNHPPESRATRYVAAPEFAIAFCWGLGDEGNHAPQQSFPATFWAGDLYHLGPFIHRSPLVQGTDRARFGPRLL